MFSILYIFVRDHIKYIISILIYFSISIFAQNTVYVDQLHPRNYTKISECASWDGYCNNNIIIHSNGNYVHENILAEVDKNSKIIIEFDREKIIKLTELNDGEITITGRIGAREIEIPGYYEIGKEIKVTPAFFRSGNELLSSLIRMYNIYLNNKFIHPLENIQTLLKEQKIQLLNILSAHRDDGEKYNRAQQIITELQQEGANYALQIEKMKKDSTGQESIKPIQDKLDTLKKIEIEWMAKRDNIFPNPSDQEILSNYNVLKQAHSEFLVDIPTFELFIHNVLDESNFVFVKQLSKITYHNQHFVKSVCDDLTKKYFVELKKYTLDVDELIEKKGRQIDSTINALIHIKSILDNFSVYVGIEKDFTKMLTFALGNTEVSLPVIDAKPGDNVILKISTKTSSSDLARTLTVNLHVREFGFLHKISDSFIFLKALYPDTAPENLDETMVGKTFLTNNQYTPSPGVSFFWTYFFRKYNGQSSLIKNINHIGRWLKPGFGFNVSFPNFSYRTVRFQNSTLIQDDDNEINQRSLILEETSSDINISFGLVGSLFENAIQFTFGWNLSSGSGRNRQYFGMGFSFINLARKIVTE